MKHGHATRNGMSRTYMIWLTMTKRCRDPKAKGYARYGGRGIHVCGRWLTFNNFLADIGEIPRPLQIDRIYNDGNYEPSNCKLSTRSEQAINSSTAHKIAFNGEILHVRGWEARLGLGHGALWQRLKKGWPLERALTTQKVK